MFRRRHLLWGTATVALLAASLVVADWHAGVTPLDAGGAAAAAPQNGIVRSAVPDPRPNIILITTDDMAETDLRWMPATRRLLRDRGVEVDDFISNHPLCCPARAQILTGQQAQNNGVHDNGGPWGGYASLRSPSNHVGAWLKRSGYKTAFIGKHLNSWESSAAHQGGWTVFDPIVRGMYRPNRLTMFNNGRWRFFRDAYTADLVGRRAVRYVKRFSTRPAPFFVWVSQLPPHTMIVEGKWHEPVPAPRHADLYPNAMPPSLWDPSFNEEDVTDKPDWIRNTAPVLRQSMIDAHRARVRSLRAVDEQVRAMVEALRDTHELQNTYIFFTSDNGYLLGEHRLKNKNKLYEESLQVPLLVRGPGLPRGVRRPATYGLADLAPTFVQLSGAAPRRVLDGRSMVATLRRGAPGYPYYLIQAALGNDSAGTGPADGSYHEWWWRGVRSRSYVYVRYEDGFEELYDMAKDPHQLTNVAGVPAYEQVRVEYAARLDRLITCIGESCRTGGR